METKIAVFKGKGIRRHWDECQEKWYFAVVDVIAVLTGSENPAVYWRVMKKRLLDEGASETVTKCNGLKMLASDGKMRLTNCADTEVLFRLIQSIPSPNAEPFKLWLARVGYERVEETIDPELAIQRGLQTYLKKGYSPEWVNMRLKSIDVRKALTDEWQMRGVKNNDAFAILTDIITLAWAGMPTKDYKKFKGLKKENLRDNMTNLELVLTMLAEATTTEISKTRQPQTFHENKKVAHDGGSVAGRARKDIERRSGKPVITRENYLYLAKKKQLPKRRGDNE